MLGDQGRQAACREVDEKSTEVSIDNPVAFPSTLLKSLGLSLKPTQRSLPWAPASHQSRVHWDSP
jgi:hypothetical protein